MRKIFFLGVLSFMAVSMTAQDNSDAADKSNLYVELETKTVKVPVSSVKNVSLYSIDGAESPLLTTAEELAELQAAVVAQQGQEVSVMKAVFSEFTQNTVYNSNNGGVGSTVGIEPTANNKYRSCRVEVGSGDIVKLSTYGGGYCRAYYMVDADGKILACADSENGNTLKTYSITVSNATAKYLLVNCYKTGNTLSDDDIYLEHTSGLSAKDAMMLSEIEAAKETASQALAAAQGGTSGGGVGTLSGLTFMGFGDSVAAGAKSGKKTWTAMAAELCGGEVLLDVAHAGDNLAKIRAQVDNASTSLAPDVVFLEGSLNDMCGTNEESGGTDFYTVEQFESQGIGMGTLNAYDFSAPAGTATDLTSQVEYIMYTVKKNYPKAKVMWVLTHRTSKRNLELQENIYQRITECGRKWGVAIIDVFHESGLNAANSSTTPSGMTDDSNGGTHPTLAGYQQYYMPMIMQAVEKYAKKLY